GIGVGAGEQQYQLPEVLPGGTPYGTLTLSSDHTFFTFTPAVGFTGLQTFTYEATDGGTPSNDATVTIDVHPVTYADVPAFINDGSSLHLDDLNGGVSGTSAPAPVADYWYA